VKVVRPMKSSASLRLSQRVTTIRPSVVTGSNLDSEEVGGSARALPANVASMSSICPGFLPANFTVRPERCADSSQSRSRQAPARSMSRPSGTLTTSAPPPVNGMAPIAASMAGSSLPRQLPDISTSSDSPS
jgi:hypothetical protein